MPGRRLIAWGLVGGLLALPLLAEEPSLGEAGRKERERREKGRESGAAARTFTEEDLATTKGQLANDPNAPPAMAPESKADRPRGDVSRRGQAPAEAPSRDPQETYWRARAGAARWEVAVAKADYDRLQRMILLGQPEEHGANGQVVMRSIYRMKALADAAAAELASAQSALDDVLEQGRRAGAQPGWLR